MPSNNASYFLLSVPDIVKNTELLYWQNIMLITVGAFILLQSVKFKNCSADCFWKYRNSLI